jgi:hypothetical protein
LTEKVLNPGGSPGPKLQRAGNPFDYKVIPQKRLVFVKYGKRVTQREIARYASALRGDPSFDPGFSELVDAREMEELDLPANQMMEVADKIDPFSFDAKRAFVVRNSVHAHEVRMYQILRLSKESISIFYSLEEAERWIGKTIPKILPK